MHKKLALQMLTDPPKEVVFLNGIQLDVLKNEKLLLDVGFWKSFESFIVTFNSKKHSKFNRLFFKAGRETHTESKANIFVHNMACAFNSEILSAMATEMLKYRQEDKEDFKTTFVGAGVPACLMVMCAASSPPHNLYSFGMPGFSTARPFTEMVKKAYDRKVRLGPPNDVVMTQRHYILPSDGTYRVTSDYFLPVQELKGYREPTLRERMLARLTTFPRLGIKLEKHANTTF